MGRRSEYRHETARITITLDPQIETTLDDGSRVPARRLFVDTVNTDGKWEIKDRVQASVAKQQANRPDRWSGAYYAHPITVTPVMQQKIDHAISLLS